MTDDELMNVLRTAEASVATALDGLADWGLAGTKGGQHLSDLVADEAAVTVLVGAGLTVLSEESGHHDGDADITVVLDPLDGSTNAHRGLPWYATSLCAVDGDGPRAAVVTNLSSGRRFEAVRGGGATLDDQPIHPSTTTSLSAAVVTITGYPPRHLGWHQFRTYGAIALDLCAVAAGSFDADRHHLLRPRPLGLPWRSARLHRGRRGGGRARRDLVTTDGSARRVVLATATPELLDEAQAAWSAAFDPEQAKATHS